MFSALTASFMVIKALNTTSWALKHTEMQWRTSKEPDPELCPQLPVTGSEWRNDSDSGNSLSSVCFKPLHLLPVVSLVFCFACACVGISALLPPSSYFYIFPRLLSIFFLHHTLLSILSQSHIGFSALFCALFLSPLFSPPCSFSHVSRFFTFLCVSATLLSFSPTLFILALPSALYKLDWWLNPTCIKVRITIFAPAHTHHTHTNGGRQWQPY